MNKQARPICEHPRYLFICDMLAIFDVKISLLALHMRIGLEVDDETGEGILVLSGAVAHGA